VETRAGIPFNPLRALERSPARAEAERAVIDFVSAARAVTPPRKCNNSDGHFNGIYEYFGRKNTKPPMALHLIGKPRVLETDTRPRRYLPYPVPPSRRRTIGSVIALIRLIEERFRRIIDLRSTARFNLDAILLRSLSRRTRRIARRAILLPDLRKGNGDASRTRPLNYYNSRPVWHTHGAIYCSY